MIYTIHRPVFLACHGAFQTCAVGKDLEVPPDCGAAEVLHVSLHLIQGDLKGRAVSRGEDFGEMSYLLVVYNIHK